MATISVIIPTYKPGLYFDKCLRSIASQSYQDYELIIILNGCDEPYRSQIYNYLEIYKLLPITKVIQTNQSGVSNARNLGIEASTGVFISFIDDDDYISSEYLQELLKVATFDSVTVSNIKSVFNEKMIKNHWCTCTYNNLSKEGYKNLFKSRKVLNGPWMKLYPRKVIGETRFDTDISLGEDALFNFRISSNIKYLNTAEATAVYYYNERQGSSWSNIGIFS